MKKIYTCFLIAFMIASINTFAQPANDDCANAIDVSLGTMAFSTVDATTDGPEHPDSSCPSYSFGDDQCHLDIWYTYTADFDGYVSLSTCSSASYDSRIAVYGPGATCPVTDGDLLVCNDDGAGCAGFTSFAYFPVSNGESFIIRIGGYSSGDLGDGDFTLANFTPPPAPDNNSCGTAQFAPVVTQAQADNDEGWNDGTTTDAPNEDGTPNPSCHPNVFGEFFDAWYSFNPGPNSTIEIFFETITPDALFYLELYEDCSNWALPVDSGGDFTSTCFTPTTIANQFAELDGFTGDPGTWYIRVSTYITASLPGDFRFQLIADESTAIGENEELQMTLFPNPNSGSFTILSNQSINNASIEIHDLSGRLVDSQLINLIQGEKVSINKSGVIPPGVYLLELNASNGEVVLTRKLVVR